MQVIFQAHMSVLTKTVLVNVNSFCLDKNSFVLDKNSFGFRNHFCPNYFISWTECKLVINHSVPQPGLGLDYWHYILTAIAAAVCLKIFPSLAYM